MFKDLDQHIAELCGSADILMEYSWPLVDMDSEKQIICLKEREIFVDGYHVCVVFSKNNHTTHFMHTLQIYPSYGAFLPFSFVCKVAQKFLGTKGLYYISVIQNDRKIYIWTICKDDVGNIIDDKSYDNIKSDNYNGLDFYRVTNVSNSKFF